MSEKSIRKLLPGDEDKLASFLKPRMASSMFLLGNLHRAGLVYRGERYQGTYVASLEDGRITGVIAHSWNGNLILQAPSNVEPLLWTVLEHSALPINGLIGLNDQVVLVQSLLNLTDEDCRVNSIERLYNLELAKMKIPSSLVSGDLNGRHITSKDIDLVTRWRVDYEIEALNQVESPRLRETSRDAVERALREGTTWILEAGGKAVAMSSFNTSLPEAVQVGGVYTPPEKRRRGYGRAVVASSLIEARSDGVEQAVLFTEADNIAAQRAYESIGFRQIGRYHLVLLNEPLTLS